MAGFVIDVVVAISLLSLIERPSTYARRVASTRKSGARAVVHPEAGFEDQHNTECLCLHRPR